MLELYPLDVHLFPLNSKLNISWFSTKNSSVNVLKFQTLYSLLFRPKFCFFMQLFLKILGDGKNCGPDQTVPKGAVWSWSAAWICHFIWNLGVRNFRTFIVQYDECEQLWIWQAYSCYLELVPDNSYIWTLPRYHPLPTVFLVSLQLPLMAL